MPRVQRSNLTRPLFAHLLDRIKTRSIFPDQLGSLAEWLDTEPEVPEGNTLEKSCGMSVCGEGEFIKTLLQPRQVDLGTEVNYYSATGNSMDDQRLSNAGASIMNTKVKRFTAGSLFGLLLFSVLAVVLLPSWRSLFNHKYHRPIDELLSCLTNNANPQIRADGCSALAAVVSTNEVDALMADVSDAIRLLSTRDAIVRKVPNLIPEIRSELWNDSDASWKNISNRLNAAGLVNKWSSRSFRLLLDLVDHDADCFGMVYQTISESGPAFPEILLERYRRTDDMIKRRDMMRAIGRGAELSKHFGPIIDEAIASVEGDERIPGLQALRMMSGNKSLVRHTREIDGLLTNSYFAFSFQAAYLAVPIVQEIGFYPDLEKVCRELSTNNLMAFENLAEVLSRSGLRSRKLRQILVDLLAREQADEWYVPKTIELLLQQTEGRKDLSACAVVERYLNSSYPNLRLHAKCYCIITGCDNAEISGDESEEQVLQVARAFHTFVHGDAVAVSNGLKLLKRMIDDPLTTDDACYYLHTLLILLPSAAPKESAELLRMFALQGKKWEKIDLLESLPPKYWPAELVDQLWEMVSSADSRTQTEALYIVLNKPVAIGDHIEFLQRLSRGRDPNLRLCAKRILLEYGRRQVAGFDGGQ